MTTALVKMNHNEPDIIYPIPEWVDPVAFSVFDCYGYSLCENFVPFEDETLMKFEFSTREIPNPYGEGTVIQRIATQVI